MCGFTDCESTCAVSCSTNMSGNGGDDCYGATCYMGCGGTTCGGNCHNTSCISRCYNACKMTCSDSSNCSGQCGSSSCSATGFYTK